MWRPGLPCTAKERLLINCTLKRVVRALCRSSHVVVSIQFALITLQELTWATLVPPSSPRVSTVSFRKRAGVTGFIHSWGQGPSVCTKVCFQNTNRVKAFSKRFVFPVTPNTEAQNTMKGLRFYLKTWPKSVSSCDGCEMPPSDLLLASLRQHEAAGEDGWTSYSIQPANWWLVFKIIAVQLSLLIILQKIKDS